MFLDETDKLFEINQNFKRPHHGIGSQIHISIILETICTIGRDENDLITDGTGSGVWIQATGSPTEFLEIPDLREEALETGWSDNNCFAGMGTHSWYRMEDYEETNCEEQVPVFGLWNRNMELQGFGLSVSGLTANQHFENPPTLAVQVRSL